jgi:hypothetical protein
VRGAFGLFIGNYARAGAVSIPASLWTEFRHLFGDEQMEVFGITTYATTTNR